MLKRPWLRKLNHESQEVVERVQMLKKKKRKAENGIDHGWRLSEKYWQELVNGEFSGNADLQEVQERERRPLS